MIRFRLDHDGVGAVLKSGAVARAVREAAEKRAAAVRAHPEVQAHAPDSVVVEDYVTDRAASAVVLRHAAGVPLQAKYGVMTKGG